MAQRQRSCRLKIEWLDKDGYIVGDDTEYVRLKCCGATETFRGYSLLTYPAADAVHSVSAEIGCD